MKWVVFAVAGCVTTRSAAGEATGGKLPSMSDDLELDWKGRAPRNERDAAAAPAPQVGLAQPGKGLPGEPQHMSDELRLQLAGVLNDPELKVRQFRETLQMLIGWDQASQFEVSGADHRPIFYAVEQRGFLSALLRNFNPFHQRHIECMTLGGTRALTIDFPFTLILRRGEVKAWDGRVMGRVQQRFSLLRTWLDIETPGGAVQLSIVGPILKFFSFSDWVFEVRRGETVVAKIKKHWGGFFAETFGTSDNFTIAFDDGFTDGRLRQLLVAAALTLDLARFEQQQKGGSLWNLLDG